MGYDPNDPNQDSQNSANANGGWGQDQSDPTTQNRIVAAMNQGGINDLVRSRPAVATWLAQHNNGRNLSKGDQAQLFNLIQSQGIDANTLELQNDGTFQLSYGTHTGRDILTGLLLAFGPVAIAAAVPAVAGLVGSAGAGATGTAGGAAAGASGGVEAGVTAGLGTAALPGAGTALVAPAVGAAGVSTAGAGIAGLADVEGGATSGLGTATLPGAGTSLDAGGFDAAGNFVGDTTYSGNVGTGSRIANLANNIGKGANSVASLFNNGQDPALSGIGAANAANQAARNRILAAQVDQGGPAADKGALANMRTAGLMTSFKDAPASPYGSPAITIGQPTRDLAAAFQQELLKRQAAGKSLTTFGVPDPTQQELDDAARARDIANGGSGVPGRAGQIINGVNTGVRIAGLVQNIGSMF